STGEDKQTPSEGKINNNVLIENNGESDILSTENDIRNSDEATGNSAEGGNNDNLENESIMSENHGSEPTEYVVVMQFNPEDSAILRCPLDINEAIVAAGVTPGTTSEVKTNINRSYLILKTYTKKEAEKWLEISSVGGKVVRCRWAKETSMSTFGVIGPIQCPYNKDEMESMKLKYIKALKDSGTEAISVSWISKREKRNDAWVTEMTRTLKIEFAEETPEHVLIGSIRFAVGEYTPETIQCFNCQNVGHTGKHCHANQPVCVFCGVKGHRVKDRRCRTRRPHCYNCRGEHPSSYRGCIAFKKEKVAQKLKLENRMNIHEARRHYDEVIYPQLDRKVPPIENRRQDDVAPEEQRRPWSQVAAQQNKRAPPIEGTRWGPATPIQTPKPQRNPTENRRRHESRRKSSTNTYSHDNTQEIIQGIRVAVKETLKDNLSKALEGFATLIFTTIHTHGISEEVKRQIVKEGINEICSTILDDSIPEELPQASKRRRTGSQKNNPNEEEEQAQAEEMEQDSESEEESEEETPSKVNWTERDKALSWLIGEPSKEKKHSPDAAKRNKGKNPEEGKWNQVKGRSGWKKKH
ncbi:unnamed protein product, partial [Meganyctiphanes norvegica]